MLAMFIIIGALNIILLLQLRRQNKALGVLGNVFKREQRTLLIVFIIYECSYLTRFLNDTRMFKFVNLFSFAFFMLIETGFILDMLAMLTLLLFHYYNFKQQSRQ